MVLAVVASVRCIHMAPVAVTMVVYTHSTAHTEGCKLTEIHRDNIRSAHAHRAMSIHRETPRAHTLRAHIERCKHTGEKTHNARVHRVIKHHTHTVRAHIERCRHKEIHRIHTQCPCSGNAIDTEMLTHRDTSHTHRGKRIRYAVHKRGNSTGGTECE